MLVSLHWNYIPVFAQSDVHDVIQRTLQARKKKVEFSTEEI